MMGTAFGGSHMGSRTTARAVVGWMTALLLTAPGWATAQEPGQPYRRWGPAAGDIDSTYIQYPSGSDSVRAYLAYPFDAEANAAMIVVPEAAGLTAFPRDVANRLARMGYVAIVPDLLSRRGGTPDDAKRAEQVSKTLNADTITQDLNAAFKWLQGDKQIG